MVASVPVPVPVPVTIAREVLTVEEAARVLGISRYLAYEGVRSGEIPSLRVGRRIVVPRVALDRLLAEAGGDALEPRDSGQPQ